MTATMPITWVEVLEENGEAIVTKSNVTAAILRIQAARPSVGVDLAVLLCLAALTEEEAIA